MTRTLAAWTAIALAAALWAPSAGSVAPAGEAAPRPNVLIVLTDDQRAEDTMRAMPATRRLFFREGRRYPDAYATTPHCCPSRASIMTGQYAHNHHITTNAQGNAPGFRQRSTLQRYLSDAGYRTAIVGKYLNNWNIWLNPPFFDDWAIFSRATNYFDVRFNVDGKVEDVPGYLNRYLTRSSLEFLSDAEAEDERPWFLFFSPYAPHMPAIPEARHRTWRVGPLPSTPARGERDRLDKPQWVQGRQATVRNQRRARAKQMRSLRSVDDSVAQIYATLEALGETDTLAFFLSDNGYLWGEHGLMEKKQPYTDAVRVPFAMRWPGRIAGGEIDDRMAATIDVAPTILDALGIEPDPKYPIDGRSLFGDHRRSRILLEYWPTVPTDPPHWSSIRTPSYQFIQYYGTDGATPMYSEYYDLINDPWQLQNALGDVELTNDPATQNLESRLAEDRACVGATCP